MKEKIEKESCEEMTKMVEDENDAELANIQAMKMIRS